MNGVLSRQTRERDTHTHTQTHTDTHTDTHTHTHDLSPQFTATAVFSVYLPFETNVTAISVLPVTYFKLIYLQQKRTLREM